MKKLKYGFLFLVLLFFRPGQGQSLESFPLSAVKLSESPFYRAQQTDMKYILELEPDRLLAPFVIDAGLEPEAKRYGNWENTGLDGHIGGHYLSALAMMYAATGNSELRDRLNYMTDVLDECQQANGNGYIGGIPGGQEMWKEIAKGKIEAGNFSLNGKWVPLYNIHKLFAGLRDAYTIAGNKKARELLVKLSDWLVNTTSKLSDEQIQELLVSEHGGMNEVLADVAAITGDKKYLTLAEKFSHRKILDPLLHQKDQLTGLHANTQIPKVIGFERIAELDNNDRWAKASGFFWNTVVENRTVSVGGNSVREHFHPTGDFSSMIESVQGPETCNTYNMLRLTKMLFLASPEGKYMDYFERALYNHILSSQNPEGGFVYFTPMRPRHYRVYSQPEQGFWCCVGSGLENHGKYGELIYAHNDTDIYVNLFIASSLNWEKKGIVLTQETGFPYEEESRIKLNTEKPSRFKLYVRRPAWVKQNDFKIEVNGKEQHLLSGPSGYMAIDRTWQDGDNIAVKLPMHTVAEYLEAEKTGTSRWVSFVHGPIVLAAITDTTDLDGLFADDSRMGHVANGELYPIDEAPLVVSEKKEDPAVKVNPLKENPMTFTAPNLIYPDKYKNLKLVPFFTVHNARYMIYWPLVEKDNLNQKLDTIRKKEKKRLALKTRTVDQVATGEQQPETEHNFKGEKTNTGINKGHFWRDSRAWFSYELNNAKGEGKVLRITYSGEDKDRSFDILVNDVLLAEVKPDGTKGNKLYDVDYKLTDEMLEKTKGNYITVKFVARKNSVAGGIYHIRLLKD
ncbi:glycoside hydrolase family 127 protein [Sinomicrobium kalidii]|uniref:glycoside hydrolase family 127 protein n=1 Tax=Sinomicrobium kalidii TaxID=2900738 RepID=UPI001E495D63|nr:glycoside hydrolase family 127 protein [Sinomicrobium kalidii]UGU14889.1 glycoside hydrolase family 127 protein [Sinomicrobium kalidii]